MGDLMSKTTTKSVSKLHLLSMVDSGCSSDEIVSSASAVDRAYFFRSMMLGLFPDDVGGHLVCGIVVRAFRDIAGVFIGTGLNRCDCCHETFADCGRNYFRGDMAEVSQCGVDPDYVRDIARKLGVDF